MSHKKTSGQQKKPSMQDMMKIVQQMSKNPDALGKALSEGPKLTDQGNKALYSRKFDKAAHFYKQAIEVMDGGWGKSDFDVVPSLVGLCEASIGLKDWTEAEKCAKRVLRLAIENDQKTHIKIADELLDEIDRGRIEKSGDQDQEKEGEVEPNNQKDLLCKSCKGPLAKFRCGSCRTTSYCSKECQRSHWSSHKPICVAIRESNVEPKPVCGLCGFEGSRTIPLTKTPCCDQWVCQDVQLYSVGSYLLNSCLRNHMWYTQCKNHKDSNHKGKHQDCAICAKAYADMKTSCPEEIEWKKFVMGHFLFENVGEKERKRNHEIKTDGTKAFVIMHGR